MPVNVFVIQGDSENQLLVLPISPPAVIPHQYQVDWVYYASVSTGDRMFRNVDAATLKEQIGADGFALVITEVPNRSRAPKFP